MRTTYFVVASIFCFQYAGAFTFNLPEKKNPSSSKRHMFFANEMSDDSSSKDKNSVAEDELTKNDSTTTTQSVEDKSPGVSVELVTSDNEKFLNAVGSFLVDNFWLQSEHHKIASSEISAEARMSLVIEQCADLSEKYGERLGLRLLNCCAFGAVNPETKDLIGVATLKETILINDDVLEAEKAEIIAKNAVAGLGPKQRREYKGASIDVIASELLSPDTKAIAVFSNLAVSKSARNMGVARQLCNEAEVLAQGWGFDEVWLLVESENKAARSLYEKLGYKVSFTKVAETGLRADIETGEFVEVQADTLGMFKKI